MGENDNNDENQPLYAEKKWVEPRQQFTENIERLKKQLNEANILEVGLENKFNK